MIEKKKNASFGCSDLGWNVVCMCHSFGFYLNQNNRRWHFFLKWSSTCWYFSYSEILNINMYFFSVFFHLIEIIHKVYSWYIVYFRCVFRKWTYSIDNLRNHNFFFFKIFGSLNGFFRDLWISEWIFSEIQGSLNFRFRDHFIFSSLNFRFQKGINYLSHGRYCGKKYSAVFLF